MAGAVGVAIALVASACTPAPTDDYTEPTRFATATSAPSDGGGAAVDDSATAVLRPDFTDTGAGSVVTATETTTAARQILDTGARGMTITYRSTTGPADARVPTVVSGTVFVPAGTPPVGGWPVIAYGHSQTGVRNECGPSLFPDLLGHADQVAGLLLSGYVVAVPDYQGLGSPGAFPMSDPDTLGANMIDAVRAARRIAPDAAPRWAAYGASIGGTASWASNEMAAEYAPELDLAGSVSLVPSPDLTEMPSAAATSTLSAAQRYQYVLEVVSIKRTSHPEMNVEDYIGGETFRNLELLSACVGPDADRAAELAQALPASDTVPKSSEATERLRGWLRERALPRRTSTAPMLLIYATTEATSQPEWTAAAVRAACDLGSRIEVLVRVGQTDATADTSPAVPWLRDTVDGVGRASDSCS